MFEAIVRLCVFLRLDNSFSSPKAFMNLNQSHTLHFIHLALLCLSTLKLPRHVPAERVLAYADRRPYFSNSPMGISYKVLAFLY